MNEECPTKTSYFAIIASWTDNWREAWLEKSGQYMSDGYSRGAADWMAYRLLHRFATTQTTTAPNRGAP